jgi:glycosyltransferase involved in cell wall biosynthesis
VSYARTSLRPVAGPLRRGLWEGRVRRAARRAAERRAELAVFHDFVAAPAGGANQTLRAVLGEMSARGVRIEYGAASSSTQAILFNSFNFDAKRLEWFARRVPPGCRMVHRVGAVTSLYRGFDDGTDARVAELNRRFADATLAISQATIDMYRSIGVELVEPRVVYNAVDPAIFHPAGRVRFDRGRKTRLIAVSWSDNPRKGGPIYRWLDSVLDWSRYEFTFVGNTGEQFERISVVPPLSSQELAQVLRNHDVFVTGTEHDAYSNALVEALSCGLPAVYLDSGGSREAVKDAGFGFSHPSEIPDLLDRIRDEYDERQALISLPSLEEVADGYLDVLGLHRFMRKG